jgi:phage terminase large subunit
MSLPLSNASPRVLPGSLLNLEAIRRERERRKCATDPVHWLDSYGWTYDPRLKEPFLRFRPFPRQGEFLRWLTEREANQEDGLAEKSRDVGFSWLCCAYALHGWLFRPAFACGIGSRKLDLVDKRGDPDCLFEKIRMLLRRLPEWQMPAGFKWSEHDNFARLVNPASGATITGEGGENIGRGGRKTIYLIDEAAFLEQPETVEAALSATTNCRIYTSTPNGQGNPYYRKRFSGAIPVFTFHWRDDPRKDDAWYARMKRKIGDPVIIAQELDIDYAASLEGVTIPAAWVRAAVNLDLPASGDVIAGFDVAVAEERDRCVVIGRRGPRVLPPTDWGGLNTTESSHRAADCAEEMGATILHYDAGGVGEGVRGTLDSSERELRFTPNGVLFGATPSDTLWPDGKTSAERFVNMRAEMWWLLRKRFERTYERVAEGIDHPPEECISIPDHPQLIADLSLPLYHYTESGKLQLEKKSDMRKRGVKSPDFGDALALTEARSRSWQVF